LRTAPERRYNFPLRTRKQGHSEFSAVAGGGLAGAEVTGGAGTLPHLPIDVFAIFDGEHVQPIGTDSAVENAIGPDPVRPDLILLKVAFQRFAIEGMFSEVTEGFFDSFSRGVVTILDALEV
jgi:hypothetical protein